MKMKKIAIPLMLGSFLMMGNVFADPGDCNISTVPGDCTLVGGAQYHTEMTFPTVPTVRKDDNLFKRSAIIDTASLNRALLNLKKNCCEKNDAFYKKNINNCKQDEAYTNNKYGVLESCSFFDHLYDIQSKRLAGQTGENYLYEGVTPDQNAAERRTRINEVAENLSGTAPLIVNNKYQETRKVDTQNNIIKRGLVQISSNNPREYVDNMQTGKNLEILNRYEELTLGEKYENLCNITRYIYSLFNSPAFEENKTEVIDKCTTQTKQRIQQETEYVKTVSTNRSNDLLANNIHEYMTYIIEKLIGQESPLEKVRKIRDDFASITRAVPELTLNCVPA